MPFPAACCRWLPDGGGEFKSPLRHVSHKPWSERFRRCGRGFVVSELMRPQACDLGFCGVSEGWTPGIPSIARSPRKPWSERVPGGRGVVCKWICKWQVRDRPQRSGRKGFGLCSSSTSQLRSACTDGWSRRTRRVMGGFELDLVLALADRYCMICRTDRGPRRLREYGAPQWPTSAG